MPHPAELLRELGLKDAAAKIYLYLLKAKKATILEVAKRTGIARTNIYHNLETLKRSHLVTSAIEGKRTYWVPESPDHLVRLMLNKTTLAREAAKVLDQEYQKSRYEAKIRFGEGEEGFKKFAEEILTAREKPVRQLMMFASVNEYVDRSYLHHFWIRRSRIGVSVKILIPYGEKRLAHRIANHAANKKQLREIRFLPQSINISVGFSVFDDKVIFFGPKNEGYHFLFESPAFAKTVKSIFDFLWEVSELF